MNVLEEQLEILDLNKCNRAVSYNGTDNLKINIWEATMKEKFSLNEQTLQFLLEFEKSVEAGIMFTAKELVVIFRYYSIGPVFTQVTIVAALS